MAKSLRSDNSETQNAQTSGSESINPVGVRASNTGISDSIEMDYTLRASEMEDPWLPAKSLSDKPVVSSEDSVGRT